MLEHWHHASSCDDTSRRGQRWAYRFIVLGCIALQFWDVRWSLTHAADANMSRLASDEWVSELTPAARVLLPFLAVIGAYGYLAGYVGLLMFWRPARWLVLILPIVVFHLVERLTPPVASRASDRALAIVALEWIVPLLPVALAFLPPFRAQFRTSTTRWWMVGLGLIVACLVFYLLGVVWRFSVR